MSITRRSGQQFNEINVTPLTDVFLVLLVIMILVAPLVNMSVLKVSAPTSSNSTSASKPDPTDINARITETGVVTINGIRIEPPDTDHIQQALEANKHGTANITLNIQSDKFALQKYAVAVMDAAAGARINNVRVLPLHD